MVRTSLSVHGRLLRVQALRHKREKIDGAANADAWAQHVAEQSMVAVVNAESAPLVAASPQVAPVATPVEAPAASVGQQVEDGASEPLEAARSKATPVEAPACVDEKLEDDVSETATNSQYAAFETWLSEQSWNRGSSGSDETDLHEVVAKARLTKLH
jgi:hypothetical protein